MPRRRKHQRTPEPTDPVPIGDVIAEVKDRFPEAFAAGEAAKQDPEPQEPTPGSQATAPQATEQPPAPDSPPFEPTAARVKSWGETVRPWESYPTAGIERVELTSPNFTGIRFSDDRKRTTDEKAEMEAAGIRFWNQPEAWLEKATPEARDRTKAMARSFAERRMAEDKERSR